VIACPSCGQENPDGFRFCGRCGNELASASTPTEVRKVVTVVFCDLTGSTALGHASDPETLRTTMRGYYDEVRSILERHGGTVEKFVGDAVMAVFGVPVSHEDDALRAVRAAWEMRTAVPALGLSARIGVNTGEVVAGSGDSLVTGDAVNVAARLEQAAEPGEVLVGAETQRLVRDAVAVQAVHVVAKGKPDPVAAFRLVEVDPGAAAIARRFDTPLIGRGRELAVLGDALSRAVEERACHLFTLLGPAGVGKSRLVAEFLAGSDAAVVRGRCLDYGEGITYWPVIEVLKQLGPAADAAVDEIAEGAATPRELQRTVRHVLEDAARERPLIAVFDDIHWGEGTFLDLVDHMADLSRGAPILLLCLARPELLEVRPAWGGGKLNASTVLLEPLSNAESETLLDSLGDGFTAETRERVLITSGGNPLFVEEMVALARESGRVEVPSSIQALLQARLDRLGNDERAVIERGAVEGEVFHSGAVRELAPKRNDVEENLVGLVRKELIRPERATLAGDDAYRFRHLLIRDAAYDALPKSTRADLHERFATWLERRGGLIELDEIVGHHLEQAVRYRTELGLESAELAVRAGGHLAEAGRKAHTRDDLGAAVNLFDRAVALLGETIEGDAVVLDLAELAEERSDFAAFDRTISRATASGDSRIRHRARLISARAEVMRSPRDAVPRALATIAEIEPLLADDVHESHYRVALTNFFVDWMSSRSEPAQQSLEEASERARLLGDRRLERGVFPFLIGTACFGPSSPAEMDRIATALEARSEAIPSARRAAGSIRAAIADLAGDTDRSLELIDGLIEEFRELGDDAGQLFLAGERVRALVRGGRLRDAIAGQETCIDGFRALGLTAYLSTQLAELAWMYYDDGRAGDALRLLKEVDTITADEDVINFALTRCLRARIRSDTGDHAEAEQLAREGLSYALETDFPWIRGEAHIDLARVLARAGRGEEAHAEALAAVAEHEKKHDVVKLAEGRKLLESL
jgi:class 3 adenylate cyclase/tetratricopeptide (TPR) repeat protein